MINSPFIPKSGTQIKGVRHENETLEIKFVNGSIYSYKPVTKKMYEDLNNASSAGVYFHSKIRKNKKIIYKNVTNEYKN